MNKKRLLIIITILILLIIALWFCGIIPKQIGKIYGTNYMKEKFPEMKLEYVNIEWNKYYGDYIITFKDKDDQTYSCVIGPKYFPISLGQGVFAIEEKYKAKYSFDTTEPYIPEGLNVADGNEVNIPADSIEYNRDVNNVTIEVIEDTITNTTVEILITDNNEDPYGWGVEFKVQEKLNGKWEDLEYISDDVSWIAIAYLLDGGNQLTLKINIEEYYGKLDNGIYRIVKPVYDNGYVDIYSNEFEIKN